MYMLKPVSEALKTFPLCIYSNIDTGELCEYFSNHLGEMKEIYSLLDDLNNKVTNVLQSTAQVKYRCDASAVVKSSNSVRHAGFVCFLCIFKKYMYIFTTLEERGSLTKVKIQNFIMVNFSLTPRRTEQTSSLPVSL